MAVGEDWKCGSCLEASHLCRWHLRVRANHREISHMVQQGWTMPNNSCSHSVSQHRSCKKARWERQMCEHLGEDSDSEGLHRPGADTVAQWSRQDYRMIGSHNMSAELSLGFCSYCFNHLCSSQALSTSWFSFTGHFGDIAGNHGPVRREAAMAASSLFPMCFGLAGGRDGLCQPRWKQGWHAGGD